MSQESKDPTQFSDYPVNLFEEPRDHANQWDVRALLPDHKPKPREEKHTHPADHRGRRPRDHANQWDVRALWPDRKP
ncbi:MAG: hypothetical protein AB1817_04860 [Chloroflexota bacterium]